MSELYDRIERLCDDRDLSVTELCRRAGVSRAALSDLKMGRKQGLSAQSLTKIAASLDITVDRLLGKEPDPLINEDPELTEYLQMLKTRPECRMLFQLSKDASREDVEASVRIIEALRNKP